jgi:hypothetical protein
MKSAKGGAAPSQGSEALPRQPFCAGLLERCNENILELQLYSSAFSVASSAISRDFSPILALSLDNPPAPDFESHHSATNYPIYYQPYPEIIRYFPWSAHA